jgi:hypothetical protein
VGAVLDDPVIVTVADSMGYPLPGARVEISSAPRIRPIEGFVPPIGYSDSPTGMRTSNTRVLSTDSVGQIRLWLQLGRVAADAYLYARAVDGVVTGRDSLAVSIRPGAPVRVHLSPTDTAVYADRTYTLDAYATDRFGNVTPDAPTLSAARTDVLRIEGRSVRTVGTGRAYVVARAGEARDSAAVSVVPRGTLLAYQRSRHSGDVSVFYLFELDGSNYRRIGDELRGFNNRSQYFLPGGERVVFHGVPPGASSLRMTLYSMDLNGGVRTIFAPSTAVEQAHFPQPTRDGAWVYFVAVRGYQRTEIWRARPDGTEAGAVGLDSQYEPVFWTPSPSPDGQRLAVTANALEGRGEALAVYDLADQSVTVIAEGALRPRWSPVGDEIAYMGGGALWVVGADGAPLLGPIAPGLYAYSGLDQGDGQVDWSPDGQWLVACTMTDTSGERHLLLVRRSNGEVLPLPHTRSRNLCGATWRP